MTSPNELPTAGRPHKSEDERASAGETLASREDTATQPESASKMPHTPSKTASTRGTTSVISRVRKLWHKLECAKFLRDLFLYTSPAVLAIVFGYFLIDLTFEKQREAAEPALSIEYALLTKDRKLLSDDFTKILSSITTNSLYVNYRMKHWPVSDIATFMMPGVRLGSSMQDQLSGAVSLYEQYLNQTKKKLSADIEALPTLSSHKLRMAGLEQLDSIAFLDGDKIREKLGAKYDENVERIASALDTLRTLKAQLTNLMGVIRIKITILNRGATDGLVRHRGRIEYPGTAPEEKRRLYKMTRIAPPSSDLSMVSVPVFQTNKEDTEDLSPQSVGKVEKDSMTAFWYEIAPRIDAEGDISQLCEDKNETILLILFDQKKARLLKVLPCNPDDDEDEG